MQVRNYIHKNQASFGFFAAYIGAILSVKGVIRSIIWFADERVSLLFEGALVSATFAIFIVGVVWATRYLIIYLRRPRGERNRYPPVSSGQVLDLYLRFMATGACSLPVAFFGLLRLRDHHLLFNYQYDMIIVIGCVPGWIAWIVAGRWLQPYPEL